MRAAWLALRLTTELIVSCRLVLSPCGRSCYVQNEMFEEDAGEKSSRAPDGREEAQARLAFHIICQNEGTWESDGHIGVCGSCGRPWPLAVFRRALKS